MSAPDFRKAIVFSCHRLGAGGGVEKGKKETLGLFFLLPHCVSQNLLPLLSCLTPHPDSDPAAFSLSASWWGGGETQTLIASSVPVFYTFMGQHSSGHTIGTYPLHHSGCSSGTVYKKLDCFSVTKITHTSDLQIATSQGERHLGAEAGNEWRMQVVFTISRLAS